MATADLVFANLGKYVDLMADIYDQSLLNRYHCSAKKICDLSCQIACLPGNSLLKKENLKLTDLHGQVVNFFYPVENEVTDKWQAIFTQAGIRTHHWSYLSAEMFNYAANHNQLVIITDFWRELAPFLKVLPLHLQVKISYGFLYKKPVKKNVQKLLSLC